MEFQQVKCERFETKDGRGYGVRLLEAVPCGAAVMMYEGDLLRGVRAIHAREASYGENDGAFVFWFQWRGVQYAIDATKYEASMSRYMNHSRANANLVPKRRKDEPGIVFYALRNIACGEELLFDYGDRSPEMVAKHPWLLY
jgi:histone-lysine N-methyltransferase SETD8